MANYIVQVQVIDLDLPPQPSGAATPVLFASSPYEGELYERVRLYLVAVGLLHQMLGQPGHSWQPIGEPCPSCEHPAHMHHQGTCGAVVMSGHNRVHCGCDYLGRGD
jgi:hypothetical protein